MDLILISEEKLKIILTQDDLKNFNIDVDSLDYANVSTKKIFWEILDRAKSSAGFNADKSKLYVQVFPSGDGGCEMFVTKFSPQLRQSLLSEKKKTYRLTESDDCAGIILILGFKELCEVCRRMSGENLHLFTTLYYDESGVYILIVRKSPRMPSYISQKNLRFRNLPEYLGEYGEIKPLTKRALAYLNEHCRKIADGNAAEILSSI